MSIIRRLDPTSNKETWHSMVFVIVCEHISLAQEEHISVYFGNLCQVCV